MKMYRCLICGDTYLGTDKPSRCPFCGAHVELIVDTAEFPAGINDVEITQQERADLEHAVGLETRNAAYYAGMKKRDKDSLLSSAYARLSKIEAEHCEVFCKLLQVDPPADLGDPSAIGADWCEDIAFSLAAENEAADFYAEAAARATTPRIKQVFEAVSDVERDHIVLDGETARIAGCE